MSSKSTYTDLLLEHTHTETHTNSFSVSHTHTRAHIHTNTEALMYSELYRPPTLSDGWEAGLLVWMYFGWGFLPDFVLMLFHTVSDGLNTHVVLMSNTHTHILVHTRLPSKGRRICTCLESLEYSCTM